MIFRRLRLTATCAVLIIVCAAGDSLTPVPAQTGRLADMEVKPGVGISFYRLLDMPSLFTGHLGEPNEITRGDTWTMYIWHLDNRPTQKLVAVFNTDPSRRAPKRNVLGQEYSDYVWEIGVDNWPRARTREGLGVGSTESQVRAVMGPPSRITEGDRERILLYEPRGISFRINHDSRFSYYEAVWNVTVYCPFQNVKNCP